MSSDISPIMDQSDDVEDTKSDGQGGATTENQTTRSRADIDTASSNPHVDHRLNMASSKQNKESQNKHQESCSQEVSSASSATAVASSNVLRKKNTQENVKSLIGEVAQPKQLKTNDLEVDQNSRTSVLSQNKNQKLIDARNQKLVTIPTFIFTMKHLEELNCSGNCIQLFPTEICGLKNLLICDLSRNDIKDIPERVNQMKSLKVFNLSHNQLVRLPEEICSLPKLGQLDVSNNKITKLPDRFYKMDGHLDDLGYTENPWVRPPIEVLNQGLRDTFQYCKELKKNGMTDTIPEQKVIFLGDPATCLVKALTSTPLLTTKSEERPSLNGHILRPEPGVIYYLYDFGHSMIYKKANFLFLNKRVIHLITFNMEEFSDKNIEEMCKTKIFPWLAMIQNIIPEAIVRIVGTHFEKLGKESETLSVLKKSIYTCIDAWMPEREDDKNVFEEKRVLRSKNKRKSCLKKTTVPTMNHLTWDRKIHLVGQSQDAFKVEELESAIISTRKEIAFGSIPRIWYDLANKLCYPEHIIALSIGHVKKIIVGDPKLKDDGLETALRYLHNVGKILWYGENPDLKTIVFHKPHLLMELLNSLLDIRGDNFFQKSKSIFRQMSYTEMEVVQDRVKEYGMLEYNMLGKLWKLDKPSVSTLCLLLENVGIGFKVDKPDDPQNLKSFIKVPLFLSTFSPEEWGIKCQTRIDQYKRPFALSFELYDKVPNGFYEKSTVFLHDMGLEYIYEWTHGLFAVASSYVILVEHDERRSAVVLRAWSDDHISTWKQICSEKNSIFQKMSKLLNDKLKADHAVFILCPHCITKKLEKPYSYSYKAMEIQSKTFKPGDKKICPRDQQPVEIGDIFPPVMSQNSILKRFSNSIQDLFSPSQTSLHTTDTWTQQEFPEQNLRRHSSQADSISNPNSELSLTSYLSKSNQRLDRKNRTEHRGKQKFMPQFLSKTVSMPNIQENLTDMSESTVSDSQLSQLSRNIGYPAWYQFALEILEISVFRLPSNGQQDSMSFFNVLCQWRNKQEQNVTVKKLVALLQEATEKGISIDQDCYGFLMNEMTF